MHKNVALSKAVDISGTLFNSFNRLCLTPLNPDTSDCLLRSTTLVCCGKLDGSRNIMSEKQNCMYQS